jgi:hypothetical protein
MRRGCNRRPESGHLTHPGRQSVSRRPIEHVGDHIKRFLIITLLIGLQFFSGRPSLVQKRSLDCNVRVNRGHVLGAHAFTRQGSWKCIVRSFGLKFLSNLVRSFAIAKIVACETG